MKGRVFVIGTIIGVLFQNLIFFPPLNPLSYIGINFGVCASAVFTYNLCGSMEYPTVKKLAFTFINMCIIINVFMTIWLILDFYKTRENLKRNLSAALLISSGCNP